ncbi:hypothetical protein J121_101 [Qipengyuania citrea LAMA 915]|uniref:Uncharacterized protein n=1 Tax=Qipengyuania citrea LAMA 915 TaxID=1306953 RepID=A0A0L1KDG2_9SPHN|nr:hypothetical protein [Qipengyuania citrea]KNH01902.1 hypothetical protein J121_101 [Qipengyuania citrea LAMA 915]
MNRLRSHFAKQAAQKPMKRLQRAIVSDYRDDIISLIADDGATLPEVADAVRAQGEPVLDPGFKAEVLKQIGTVKNIRAGRINTMAPKYGEPVPQPEPAAMLAQNNSNLTATSPDDDDDDDAFAARRPRH